MSTATVYDQDWDLFLDWCTAFGRTPVPAGSDDVDEFLAATAVTGTLRARRLRAIHHGNLRAGVPLASAQAPPDMLRVGDPWVSVSRALAQIPRYRYPVGLRGRRDAWLLSLLGPLRFTRLEAASIRAADVTFLPRAADVTVAVPLHSRAVASRDITLREPAVTSSQTYGSDGVSASSRPRTAAVPAADSAPHRSRHVVTNPYRERDITSSSLTIRGRVVPRARLAAECPACAVTGWLRVVGPATRGERALVREALTPVAADERRHDCEEPLGDDWGDAATLLPAIDRYGWLAGGEPISLRGVSATVAVRLRPAGLPPVWEGVVRRRAGRFEHASSAELAAAQDAVDDQLGVLLARSADLVEDAARVDAFLREVGL